MPWPSERSVVNVFPSMVGSHFFSEFPESFVIYFSALGCYNLLSVFTNACEYTVN